MLEIDGPDGRVQLDLAGFDARSVRERLDRWQVPAGDIETGPIRCDRPVPAPGGTTRPLAPPPSVRSTFGPLWGTALRGAALAIPAAAILVVCASGIVQDLRGGTELGLLGLLLFVAVGGSCLLGLVGLATGLARIRRHSRVTFADDGLVLGVPTERDRPVRIPWPAVAALDLEVVGTPRPGTEGLQPARLQVTLKHRPDGDVLLELLESEPDRVSYPVHGFDLPALGVAVRRARRTVIAR
ncbi:hypothetical protein [Pseudonocardia sp. NPDC049635]|uniref:hypothetical protein n=1 Tax=Pseudonocardia sp. NPDC049635 TaxID=3155506 RepID=UPI0033E11302